MIDSIRKEIHNEQAVRYGRQLVLHSGVFLLITFVLCVLSVHPSQSLLAVFSFLSLRSFAGGVHVRSRLLCLLCSVFLMMLLIFGRFEASLPVFSLLAFVIWLIAPVQHHHRVMSPIGKMRAKIICGIILLLIMVLIVFYPAMYALQSRVLMLTAILQALGYIKERIICV